MVPITPSRETSRHVLRGPHDLRISKSASALIGLAAIASVPLMWWVTLQGLGISVDSTVYIGAARSLLAGNGLLQAIEDQGAAQKAHAPHGDKGFPLTHFPPTYPILLAVSSLVGQTDVVESAGFLQILLFAANTILFGLVILRATNGSLPATAVALLFFLTSEPILTLHGWAWSEGLFIAEWLACFLALSSFLLQPRALNLLLLSLFAGAAMTTRYVGVTLLPPLVIALMVFGKKKDRIREILSVGALALFPLCLWLTRNFIRTRHATDRSFDIHIVNVDQIRELISTTFRFAIPVSVPTVVQALLLVVAGIVISVRLTLDIAKVGRRKDTTAASMRFSWTCLLFFATYVGFLLISISFLDSGTHLDFRILTPGLLAFAVAGLGFAWSLIRNLKHRRLRYGLTALMFVPVGLNLVYGLPNAAQRHKEAFDYASRTWKSSAMIAYLRDVPADLKIYSNDPYSIDWFIGRRSIALPMVDGQPNSKSANALLETQLRPITKECVDAKAIVAYFENGRPYFPKKSEIEANSDLSVLQKLEDGIIYGC